MTAKKVLMLVFVVASTAGELRFWSNAQKRVASGYRDNYLDATLIERAQLVWTVLTWPGPRIAPDGVYHLTAYVSVPTASGPIGLLPGQEVRVVRDGTKDVVVTAPTISGARELTVPRSALTEDMDLAWNIARRDGAAQREFRDRVEAEETEREAVRLDLYKKAAANLTTAENGRVASDSGVGGRSTLLHQTATSHGYGYPVAVPVYYGVPTSTSAPTIYRGTTTGITLAPGVATARASSVAPARTSIAPQPSSTPSATYPGAVPPTRW